MWFFHVWSTNRSRLWLKINWFNIKKIEEKRHRNVDVIWGKPALLEVKRKTNSTSSEAHRGSSGVFLFRFIVICSPFSVLLAASSWSVSSWLGSNLSSSSLKWCRFLNRQRKSRMQRRRRGKLKPQWASPPGGRTTILQPTDSAGSFSREKFRHEA